MSIATAILYIAILYVRPGEINPALESLRLAATTGALGIIVMLVAWVARPRAFLNQPIDFYVAGFFLAIVLSNPAWGWIEGGRQALVAIIPSLVSYLLIRSAVREPRHLRYLGTALVILTLFQAVNGILQYHTGVGFGEVEATEQRVYGLGDEAQSEPSSVRRIKGTGIFNDPNDLAMAFVAVIPFLVGPIISSSTNFAARFMSMLAVVPMLVALLYTSSRGGVLGLLAAMSPYAWRRGGWLKKVVIAIIAVTVVIVASGSRMSQIDSGEESAQGRVQAWSAGLQMLKSKPVLGVGFGRFTEFNELVAHNSFVHTVAETGLVGGFFLSGIFYWLFRGPAGRGNADSASSRERQRLLQWGDELLMACIGLAVTMIFLSRQYVPIFFIFAAMGASYRAVMQEEGEPVRPAGTRDLLLVGASLITGVGVIYAAVQVLAQFPS